MSPFHSVGVRPIQNIQSYIYKGLGKSIKFCMLSEKDTYDSGIEFAPTNHTGDRKESRQIYFSCSLTFLNSNSLTIIAIDIETNNSSL